MYKINTAGRYLVKGDERMVIGSFNYKPQDINGWTSPAHRVQVTNLDTQEVKVFFPGEPIKVQVPKKKRKTTKNKS